VSAPAAGFLWAALVVAIATLSVWGRPLQRLVRATVDRDVLVVAVAALTFAAGAGAIRWLHRRRGLRGFLELAWLPPLAILLPSIYPLVEERVHFVLFGVLGFTSVAVAPGGAGVILGASVAALDEALQAVVPGRFADWRDVGMNVLSTLVGALVALRGRAGTRAPLPGSRSGRAC
jgi:VanZ family protein